MAGRRRWVTVSVGVLLAVDVVAWGVQVVRRDARVRELAPMLTQMDSLAARIASDDEWIERNQRLLQGYGQHEDLADRLRDRGRRVTAHDALVDAYNQRLESLRDRSFFPPLPSLRVEQRKRIGR